MNTLWSRISIKHDYVNFNDNLIVYSCHYTNINTTIIIVLNSICGDFCRIETIDFCVNNWSQMLIEHVFCFQLVYLVKINYVFVR